MKKVDQKFRQLPVCDMDLIIISSYGDEWDPSIEVVPKQQNSAIASNSTTVLARKEMEAIIDKCRKDKGVYLRNVCSDWPGSQLSKYDFLERIKTSFKQCDNGGGKKIYDHLLLFIYTVVLWYTGNGERNTGNWCFKDGVITFENIFGLYMDCLRRKRLTVVSDCSYSGNWINHCIAKLDELDIPSCGHHTREQGILLRIFCSCQANEEATVMAYINEAVILNNEGRLIFRTPKKLSSEQATSWGDFRDIRCGKVADEQCEISSSWEDRLTGKPVYLVRGKDRGWEAWHYVLVDKDKVDDFKAKIASGTIDVAEYGKVLRSGWGKDPPKDVERMIDLQYKPIVAPIDVAEYGKALHSSWEKDPPKDIEHMIYLQYKPIVAPIDVAEYGKALHSGWGKDPPKDIARMIDLPIVAPIDVAEYGKALHSGCGKDPPKDIARMIDLQYVDPVM